MMEDPQEKIRSRAYHIWEAEGRPHGNHEAHWQRAEAELKPQAQATTAARKPAAAARSRKPATRKTKP